MKEHLSVKIPSKVISWKKFKREGRQSLEKGDVKLRFWRVENKCAKEVSWNCQAVSSIHLGFVVIIVKQQQSTQLSIFL